MNTSSDEEYSLEPELQKHSGIDHSSVVTRKSTAKPALSKPVEKISTNQMAGFV